MSTSRSLTRFARIHWFALFAVMFISACATNPATGKREIVLMSEEAEIAQGREYHPKIMQQYDEYEDAELQALVKSLGKDLGEKSDRSNLIYRFTLLDSDQVNAFATPGGYIYITRGLIAYLNSEAELAAVLGHEIGHVTARHSVRQQRNSTLAGIAGVGVAVATGSRTAFDLTRLLGAAATSGYGRAMELEADELGARYLARTNFTPQAMIDVIEVLKDQEVYEKDRAKKEDRQPRAYHGVFATHPRNDKRLREVIEAAKAVNPNAPEVSRAEQEAFIRKLDGMGFDKAAKEGITRGNSFYHQELDVAFDFPQGWRVDNQPQYVDVFAPQSKALIRFRMDDLNKKISPRDFLIERMKVTKIVEEEELNVNGLQGHTAVQYGTSPWGRREIRHTVIYRDDKAYVFQSTVKDRNTRSQFDDQFLTTANSFRNLTEGDKQQAKPQRIRLVTVNAGDTVESLAANSPLPTYAAEQIRLLNGLYPDRQPEVGRLIKVVR